MTEKIILTVLFTIFLYVIGDLYIRIISLKSWAKLDRENAEFYAQRISNLETRQIEDRNEIDNRIFKLEERGKVDGHYH